MSKPVGAWVTNYILILVAWLVAGVLLLFTARRWLFVLAALWPARRRYEPAGLQPLPHVLLLAPVRNEANLLPDLALALERLDYPADRLTVVFINDGSIDGSEAIMRDRVQAKPNWAVLSLPQNRGKAGALNAALAAFPQGDIIAVYDADERPLPTALRRLVLPFSQAQIGGVSGRRAVLNPLASPAAGYTTLEGLVHQLVTLRAKAKLGLAPALLGANCVYRRSALAGVGNFKPGALLEDSDLTVKLARAGWQVRFEPAAVSFHRVPETVRGYWRQHRRWARGFNEVARAQTRLVVLDSSLPLALRAELAAFSSGYLDRLLTWLAAGSLLLVRGRRRRCLAGLVCLSLLTPLVQAVAALRLDRAPLVMWLRLAWLPLFFGLDVAIAVAGAWGAWRRSPQPWEGREDKR